MSNGTSNDAIGDIVRYSRRICALIVVVAFVTYGVAYYVWTLGQSLGAIVLATMGYLLFRSLRKIAFNLTWQHFNHREGYHDIIQRLDSRVLTQKESAIREHLKNTPAEATPSETHE